jgi:hypothetical protein
MASARGDIKVLSSGNAGRAGGLALMAGSGSIPEFVGAAEVPNGRLENRGKSIDWKPNPAGGPKLGVGGG